ncbi:hypothetical protein GCM10010327_41510 [Streptomyces nitrosporeus]|nr:hypothetical protein GCM10010327_41510 [Streptomyces nitrosporeus]
MALPLCVRGRSHGDLDQCQTRPNQVRDVPQERRQLTGTTAASADCAHPRQAYPDARRRSRQDFRRRHKERPLFTSYVHRPAHVADLAAVLCELAISDATGLLHLGRALEFGSAPRPASR